MEGPKTEQLGGRREAKKVMKAMVASAKKRGVKFECDNCHQNEETWSLNQDARRRFRELLTILR